MLLKEKNGYPLRMPENNDDLTVVISEFKALPAGAYVGLDTETTGLDYYKDQVVGVCLAYKSPTTIQGFYLPIRHRDYTNLPLERVCKFTNWIIKRFQAVLFNRSFDFSMLEKEDSITIDNPISHDVQILCWEATYEKFPSLKKSYRLYCKKDIDSFAATMEKSGAEIDETSENAHNFGETDPRYTFTYGAYDPVATLELFFKITQMFPYIKVIYPLDNKVSEVIRQLTKQVYTIDYKVIESFKAEQDKILRELQAEIYAIAGYQFKIGSNREKAEALSRFVTLTKKTKKGQFEVSIPVLERIDHPLARALVKYAETHKFINSYLEPLLRTKGTEFRINYKLCEAPTARIASGSSRGNSYYAPINIQSIPSDKEILYIHEDPVLGYIGNSNPEGALGEFETKSGVRKAFTAPEGYCFMTFDFCSEELRITANLSKEPAWIEAIKNGEDLHTATSLQVFGKTDKAHRSKAKTINFGILYGMSVYSLRDRLRISLEEAKAMLARYHQRLVMLTRWIKSVQARGRKTMATSTYYGRVRPLGQYYNSSDPSMIGFADRSAVNTAVQGCIPTTISFEADRLAVKVDSPKNLRSTFKLKNGKEFVLSHRGLNYCYLLLGKSGDFLACDRNHSLFTGGRTLITVNAVESFLQRKKVRMARLQSKMFPTSLPFDRAALKKIASLVKHKTEVPKSRALSNLFWKAWFSRASVTLSPEEACNLRSIASVHGWNLKGKLVGRQVKCRVSPFRRKATRLTTAINLGTLPVASATVRWGAPVYDAQGFLNRNTAADILRIKLCELYQYWKTNKEFQENVIICWSVHDEIEFYVKLEYRAKAFKLIPQLMKVTHENWQVPLEVDGGVGYSWGTCLDGEMDDSGKLVKIKGAVWYDGKEPSS